MSNNKKIEAALRKGAFLYEDHKLVTRRDFLGAGLLQFSAFVTAPTILSAIVKSTVASAAVCSNTVGGTTTLPAFVQLNLSGGCALAMNYVPKQKDGTLPTNMGLMGLGGRANLEGAYTRLATDQATQSGSTNKLETDMGVASGFYMNSGFLRGLRSVQTTVGTNPAIADATKLAAAQTYLSKTAFVAVMVQSRDDTNTNKVGLASMIAKAGVVGSSLNVLTGQGFGASPTLIAPPTPISVNSLLDLASAVGVPSPLGDLSPGTDKSKLQSVFTLISRLSERRAAEFLAANQAALQSAVATSTTKNEEVSGCPKPPTDPVPRTANGNIPANAGDPALAAVWGINTNGSSTSREAVFAGCVYNSLTGLAGASQLNNGGNDYHNNTRTAGDAKDLENGIIAGRILQSAAVMGKRIFLVITSDGSVRSTDSATDGTEWTSDRGQAGCAYILAYDPAGRPALSNPDVEPGAAALPHQIGYINSGQSSDGMYLTNSGAPGGGDLWDPERASLAMFANYLKFGATADWLQRYKDVVPGASLNAGLPQEPLSYQYAIPKILRFG